jgi:hypothetical protein
MIDPQWEVVDLDPGTWRRLGRFIQPECYIRSAQNGEHGLFILHRQGTVQRIVDTKTGVRRDLQLEKIDNPQDCAQQLYASGEWQRVHIIDNDHLAQIARSAQATPQRELTLDEYYHQVYQLLWDHPTGYVSVPPHPGHWHGWTYQDLQDTLKKLPFSPASLALGVFADEILVIGLLLVCENGRIRKVTTFEALDPQCLSSGLTAETLTRLRQQITDTLAPPAGILLCTQEVFERWIHQEDKIYVLLTARQQEQAYWYWQR